MKHKAISLFLTIAMLFALSACNNSTTSSSLRSSRSKIRLSETQSSLRSETRLSMSQSSSHIVCSYGEWEIIQNATCTTVGTKKRTCTICGKNETKSIDEIGHIFISGYCVGCGVPIDTAFVKLTNYVVQNYDFINSDYYSVLIGSSSYDGSIYKRGIFYYPEENKIELTLSINDTYIISIEIIDGESVYDWALYDSSTEYIMLGYLYPTSFSRNSSYLSYYSTNITYVSLKTSFNELAVSSAKLLCTYLNTDLLFLEVAAYDLGFVNF